MASYRAGKQEWHESRERSALVPLPLRGVAAQLISLVPPLPHVPVGFLETVVRKGDSRGRRAWNDGGDCAAAWTEVSKKRCAHLGRRWTVRRRGMILGRVLHALTRRAVAGDARPASPQRQVSW